MKVYCYFMLLFFFQSNACKCANSSLGIKYFEIGIETIHLKLEELWKPLIEKLTYNTEKQNARKIYT